MTTSLQLRFERFSGSDVAVLRPTVRDVFVGSRSRSELTFHSESAFMQRFDAYARNPRLDFLLAFDGDRAVGQAWGWPLGPDSAWWSGLTGHVEPGFTVEDGNRTFALSEIMVVTDVEGLGIGHTLHDTLLGGRPETRGTLLVKPDNATAYRAYERWGWRKFAQLQPDWPDAPLFDVLMLDLAALRASFEAGPS